jgi:hypothetical protein
MNRHLTENPSMVVDGFSKTVISHSINRFRGKCKKGVSFGSAFFLKEILF